MKHIVPLLLAAALLGNASQTASASSWRIDSLCNNTTVFQVDSTASLPYKDNIEMAGRQVATILSYEVDTLGRVKLSREVFFPQLHQLKPTNGSWFFDYRAYLQRSYDDTFLPKLYLNEQEFVVGKLAQIRLNGMVTLVHEPSSEGVQVTRQLFPSMTQRCFVEQWTLVNESSESRTFSAGNRLMQLEDFSADGILKRRVITDAPSRFTLAPHDSICFSLRIEAAKGEEGFPTLSSQRMNEERKGYLNKIASSLQLETPSEELNTLFEFSKIRGAESIYDSKLGAIHSPGGGRYYVGIWANDQAEYINPFFPYLGYPLGMEASMNCYRAFAGEMNEAYAPLRYSFEVEGLPPFIRDRGDAAMIAFGAAQYALASGNRAEAQELWKLIAWCLEYSHRQLNEGGVVASETDEMEGRIETGTANLSTSSLYYGALHHAINLGRALGVERSQIRAYEREMKELDKAIESYFGSTIEGLDTYKYYKEHTALRHWICMPLVVGIFDRKEDTLEALFEHLWTENGVLVERNNSKKGISNIFWDRGTLYALRGAFIAGEQERSLRRLEEFTHQRLLGSRVPYVVEAAPEGSMAHLSAESGLYCRIFTEGIFGIEPISLNALRITPRLPHAWGEMALRHIQLFGKDFDLEVSRQESRIRIRLVQGDKPLLERTIREGESLTYTFK